MLSLGKVQSYITQSLDQAKSYITRVLGQAKSYPDSQEYTSSFQVIVQVQPESSLGLSVKICISVWDKVSLSSKFRVNSYFATQEPVTEYSIRQ